MANLTNRILDSFFPSLFPNSVSNNWLIRDPSLFEVGKKVKVLAGTDFIFIEIPRSSGDVKPSCEDTNPSFPSAMFSLIVDCCNNIKSETLGFPYFITADLSVKRNGRWVTLAHETILYYPALHYVHLRGRYDYYCCNGQFVADCKPANHDSRLLEAEFIEGMSYIYDYYSGLDSIVEEEGTINSIKLMDSDVPFCPSLEEQLTCNILGVYTPKLIFYLTRNNVTYSVIHQSIPPDPIVDGITNYIDFSLFLLESKESWMPLIGMNPNNWVVESITKEEGYDLFFLVDVQPTQPDDQCNAFYQVKFYFCPELDQEINPCSGGPGLYVSGLGIDFRVSGPVEELTAAIFNLALVWISTQVPFVETVEFDFDSLTISVNGIEFILTNCPCPEGSVWNDTMDCCVNIQCDGEYTCI